MNDKLISIIVPIYNSEKYLEKCISSILAQTISNFELIVVDDGSTDNSKNIIKSFNDNRIKYIYSKHFGVSSARNIGLKKATGELISFIDSDDAISNKFLELLISKITNNIDLSICSYTKIKLFTYNKKEITVKSRVGYTYILKRNIGGYVWNKIFKKSIIDKYNIHFSEHISMGEDMLFVCEYLKHCNNINIDFNKYYFYRNNKNQVTKRYDESITSVLYGWIGVLEIYKKYCRRMTNQIEYRYLKKLIELKGIIKEDTYIPKVEINYKQFSLKQKIILKIYKLFYRQIIFIKKVI